jgi:hypothetical protein
MISDIVLSWQYEPIDYFDDKLHFDFNGFKIEVSSGLINAEITSFDITNLSTLQKSLIVAIESPFIARRIIYDKEYSIGIATTTFKNKYGVSGAYISVPNATICIKAFPPEIMLIDANGVVLSDTKKDRDNQEAALRELLLTNMSKDRALRRMVKSYLTAMSDHSNELLYLYEIRDAASEIFQGAHKARKRLCVPESDWQYLGKIANESPVLEGRHRGKHLDDLRSATHEEKIRARGIALDIIIKYINIINGSSGV